MARTDHAAVVFNNTIWVIAGFAGSNVGFSATATVEVYNVALDMVMSSCSC